MRRNARRWSALVAVVAVLAVVLGSPAAANASVVTAPPPPVDDLKGLPSATKKGLTSAGGIGDQNIKTMAWLYQQTKNWANDPLVGAPTDPNAPTNPGLGSMSKNRPITGATQWLRGAAGGPLTAFTGGWAIGVGGLEIYGAVTGTEPLSNLCGTGWEIPGQILYAGTMPDCTATVTNPNADQASAYSISYGPLTYSYVGSYSQANWGPSTGRPFCYNKAGAMPAGYGLRYWHAQHGSWSTVTMLDPYQDCARFNIGGTTGFASSPSIMGNNGPPQLRVVQESTGQVVAEQTATQANPVRTPSCSILWDDGDVTNGVGPTYREQDGIPMSVDKTGCGIAWDAKPGAGEEHLPSEIGVQSTDEKGAKTEISRQKSPEWTEQQKKSLTAPSITEGLKLWQGKTSCMTWAADCASWWSDTQQGTTPGTKDYRCTFNKEQVNMDECGVYRHTFDTRTNTPTLTDPDTGTQTPGLTKPEQGNSTNPSTGPTPGGKCMDEWSAAPNPIDWVLHPLKCFAVWAFIPNPTKIPNAQAQIQLRFGQSFPGQLGGVLGGLGSAFGTVGEGGCSGIAINIANVGPDGKAKAEPHRFMAACPGDFLHPYAPYVFWGLSAALVIIAALSIKQQIDRFVNN